MAPTASTSSRRQELQGALKDLCGRPVIEQRATDAQAATLELVQLLQGAADYKGALAVLESHKTHFCTKRAWLRWHVVRLDLLALSGDFLRLKQAASALSDLANASSSDTLQRSCIASLGLCSVIETRFSNGFQILSRLLGQDLSSLNNIITVRSLATYLGVCCLCGQSMDEIRKAETASGMLGDLFGTVPIVRLAVQSFAGCEFGMCLDYVKLLCQGLLLDAFIGERAATLLEALQRRIVAQHVQAFSRVSLSRVAAALHMTESDTEEVVAQVIENDLLPRDCLGRLDRVRWEFVRDTGKEALSAKLSRAHSSANAIVAGLTSDLEILLTRRQLLENNLPN
eukprot:GHVS01028822.1.p1 GENE.GHVS01028822.1~~GHVS01028822.1.p1  ORF type:complete len:389 (-),score=37.49 GHVS01028822.1:121-1146(-)